MEKKSIWTLIGGIVAGVCVLATALVCGLVYTSVESSTAKQQIEQVYVGHLWEAKNNLADMENVAAKMLVSNGRTDSIMYACDLKRGAEGAAIAMSKLPIEGDPLGQLNKVSDYASSMIRTSVSGRSTASFTDSAETVYRIVHALNGAVSDILTEVATGRKLSDGITLYFGGANGDKQDNAIEMPELIYDGPFSDARKEPCFHGLESLPEIGEDEAARLFAETFALERVRVLGFGTEPAAYELEGYMGQTPVYASLSMNGGKIVNLTVGKSVDGKATLGEKEATRLALGYAEQLGYADLVPVWYNAVDGAAYVNLAPQEGGAILYTDLVKVKLALDDGTVMGLEAMGYCTAHRARDCKPVLTRAEALEKVSERLKVESVRLCVVPDNADETLCYEVAGTFNGFDYFVYISAVDGNEVNVLRVIDDEQGHLTV